MHVYMYAELKITEDKLFTNVQIVAINYNPVM